jgi:hypothetical protein
MCLNARGWSYGKTAPVGSAWGGLLRFRSDLGEAIREVEGGGRDSAGGAQTEHLVEGRANQARPVVRGGRPGGEMHLGGGQAQMGGDVPACEGGWLPVQANAAEGESRGSGVEPGDVERSVGPGGDALHQRAAYAAWHGLYGEAVQRKDV